VDKLLVVDDPMFSALHTAQEKDLRMLSLIAATAMPHRARHVQIPASQWYCQSLECQSWKPMVNLPRPTLSSWYWWASWFKTPRVWYIERLPAYGRTPSSFWSSRVIDHGSHACATYFLLRGKSQLEDKLYRSERFLCVARGDGVHETSRFQAFSDRAARWTCSEIKSWICRLWAN